MKGPSTNKVIKDSEKINVGKTTFIIALSLLLSCVYVKHDLKRRISRIFNLKGYDYWLNYGFLNMDVLFHPKTYQYVIIIIEISRILLVFYLYLFQRLFGENYWKEHLFIKIFTCKCSLLRTWNIYPKLCLCYMVIYSFKLTDVLVAIYLI